jgi:hypothetical protein
MVAFSLLLCAKVTAADGNSFSLEDALKASTSSDVIKFSVEDFSSDADKICAVAQSSSPEAAFRKLFGDGYKYIVANEDSNSWYVGFRVPKASEVWVYPVKNGIILWNDYSSSSINRITSSVTRLCGVSIKFYYSQDFGQYLLEF